MNFEDNHNNYLFNHLTVSPSTGARCEYPLQPVCVTTDPYTEHIYALEFGDDCLRVFILSESGIIENRFLQKGLGFPHEIAIHQDNLYIALSRKPFLVHFKVTNRLRLIRNKEDIGSGIENNKHLRRLAVSTNGEVFVAEYFKHRLQILDGNLTTSDRSPTTP